MTKFLAATPYLEVWDMIQSLAFYHQLGFATLYASAEVETREGRFPHFARLARQSVELMLNTAYDSNERPAVRDQARWQGCRHVALYIDVDDVQALHADYVAAGLQPPAPAETGYGYLGFTMAAPDGHQLIFHQPLP